MSDPLAVVRTYHERTMHSLERYAAGPAALDWDAQPDPFRRFDGCPMVELPLAADRLATPFADLGQASAQSFDLEHMGMLFELSFAISAWKAYGPDKWALRCNPSSGNLHPTESYALPIGIEGIESALYHYRADQHALEKRCSLAEAPASNGILIGLSSIHWREAWKYGERAFRYSQLDMGHAIATLSYAAASLGWQCELLHDRDSDAVASLLGLDRKDDFADAEPESPEALLWIHAGSQPPSTEALDAAIGGGCWHGKANRLDPKPLYHWPVIDEVDCATRLSVLPPQNIEADSYPPRLSSCQKTAADIIRQRRSAQHFDPRFQLPKEKFFQLLDATLPRSELPPWCTHALPARTHLILFVHRVEGLRQGLYALPRRTDALASLKSALRSEFIWEQVEDTRLPLHALVYADARSAARTLSCHQDIAGHSAFAVAMLGEFDQALEAGAWGYRHLFWEAGMIGQSLYLQAEAIGIRGTGIGCYFDPAIHDTFGISDSRLQSMYHFTVGLPLVDTRLQTLPPYPGRQT